MRSCRAGGVVLGSDEVLVRPVQQGMLCGVFLAAQGFADVEDAVPDAGTGGGFFDESMVAPELSHKWES